MVTNEGATAGDFFNGAFKALREPDVARAVVCLRRGFFENLYIAPLILGEDCAKQDIWHPSPEAEPPAAREYLKRYGDLWLEDANVRLFLREVWNDTLVRAELRSYINLSKNLFNAASSSSFNQATTISPLLAVSDGFIITTSPSSIRASIIDVPFTFRANSFPC